MEESLVAAGAGTALPADGGQQPEAATSCGKVALFFVFAILVFAAVPDALVDTDLSKPINCTTGAYCTTNPFDVAMTKLLVAPKPLVRSVGYGSHVLTMVISPLLALGSAIVHTSDPIIHAAQDVGITVAVALISLGINTVFKCVVRRQRPCFDDGMQSETEAAAHPNEQYVSFFSGDTTVAFVTFTVGLRLAQLRGRAYASRDAPTAINLTLGERGKHEHSRVYSHS